MSVASKEITPALIVEILPGGSPGRSARTGCSAKTPRREDTSCTELTTLLSGRSAPRPATGRCGVG